MRLMRHSVEQECVVAESGPVISISPVDLVLFNVPRATQIRGSSFGAEVNFEVLNVVLVTPPSNSWKRAPCNVGLPVAGDAFTACRICTGQLDNAGLVAGIEDVAIAAGMVRVGVVSSQALHS